MNHNWFDFSAGFGVGIITGILVSIIIALICIWLNGLWETYTKS